jgi:hypothetical protein
MIAKEEERRKGGRRRDKNSVGGPQLLNPKRIKLCNGIDIITHQTGNFHKRDT